MADFSQVQDRLVSLRNRGLKYGLGRMIDFAERLGNPQHQVPAIHVAGTNGKGSTCAMLEAIFREAGYRTGLYTSPHLEYLGERIQIQRHPLAPEKLAHEAESLLKVAEQCDEHPSFFEIMTAMAWRCFFTEKVDVAILETGLGGRLDATNLVVPEVSIITSIGMDHTDILGDTLEKIAAEKAGIIKPGVPVVIGNIPDGPEEVILRKAEECQSKALRVREIFRDPSTLPKTRLKGTHQRWNAACAQVAAGLVADKFPRLSPSISQGLKKVRWEGRWEEWLDAESRRIILDAAHNPEGAEALEACLKERQRSGEVPLDWAVVGVLGEARAQALLEVVSRYCRNIALVAPNQPRALSPEQLLKKIPSGFCGEIRLSSLEELFPSPGKCTIGLPGQTVLVSGSIYLLGEVITRFKPSGPASGFNIQDRMPSLP